MTSTRDRRSSHRGLVASPAPPVRFQATICYAGTEALLAGRLSAALDERGATVGSAATPDQPALNDRSGDAQAAFVFLISPESVASAACLRQLDAVAPSSMLIIPVLARTVPRDRLPAVLAARNWVSLLETDDFDAAVSRLVDALRRDVVWRDRYILLEGRAQEWLDGGRDDSLLLRGRDLAEAERWLGARDGQLDVPTAAHAEYIATSRRVATGRRRTLGVGMSLALMVSIALAAFALVQRARAVVDRQVAVSRSIAAQAVSLADSDPPLAAALSVEAYRMRSTSEAREAVRHVLARLDVSIGAMQRPEGTVLRVAISPDGTMVAGANDDKTVHLWDLATRAAVGRPLVGHTGPVQAVTFSPDGKLLASVAEDATLRIWDVASGRALGKPMKSGASKLGAVAFDPKSGKTIAVGANDGTVRLWDLATRKELGQLPALHGGRVESLGFTPDGLTLASASDDTTVRLWDVPSRQPIWGPLEGHTDAIFGLAFSPDGATLATAGDDGTLRIWDVATGRLAEAPIEIGDRPRNPGFLGVAFRPDGRAIATTSLDTSLRLWSVATGRQIEQPVLAGAWGIAFTPDARSIVSGGGEDGVDVWNVARDPGAAPVVEILPRASLTPGIPTKADAFSPDGRLRAFADDHGRVRLQDADDNVQLGAAFTGDAGVVREITFSPDAKTLATGGLDTVVRLWSVSGRATIGELATGPVSAVAFSPDGAILATAGNGARLWDVATHRSLGRLEGESGTVHSIAFSPDGATIATAGADSKARLWDVATRRQRGAALGGYDGVVSSVAFSSDGRTLATTSTDGTVRLWTIDGDKPRGRTLRGHSDAVLREAFSPDGRTLATASFDQTIRLWDVASGAAIAALPAGPSTKAMVFDPGGRSFTATSSTNGETRWDAIVWSRNVAAQMARLCGAARRDLSRAEWDTYLPGETYHRTCE